MVPHCLSTVPIRLPQQVLVIALALQVVITVVIAPPLQPICMHRVSAGKIKA